MEGYSAIRRQRTQVPLIADAVAEPRDDQAVDVLEWLPPDEATFYSREEHVVDLTGKSMDIAKELEETFAFVGGTEEEYARYLNRADLPAGMRSYALPRDAQAFGCFSARTINQSNNQSISRSIDQSMNQSIIQSID